MARKDNFGWSLFIVCRCHVGKQAESKEKTFIGNGPLKVLPFGHLT